MRIRSTPLLATLALAVSLAGQPGNAAPVCTGSVPQALCGDRVIADPLASGTFIQYGTEAWPALDAIEKIAPDVVEVRTLAEWTKNKKFVSAGGLQIPVIRITDERVPQRKKKIVVASLSVHGNEPAGREGGLRYAENLARWWKSDKQRKLYSGNSSMPLATVLAKTELWLGVPNVDGWAAGDLTAGNTFQRGNKKGTDLNREFPTKGWTNRSATPLSDPESIGWAAFVRSLPRVDAASDIHGELTSANAAYADLMWPAGQWDPKKQAQELQLAKNMIRTVERKFVEQNVALGLATDAVGVQAPSDAATGYDVVGYDDGGFMGDWFTQEFGALEIDAENFLSHMAPGNAWVGVLEQAHVAGVQGILESLMVESHITSKVKPSLSLGKVAYAYDPRRVTSADGYGYTFEPGDKPKKYSVTRMKYFQDLRRVSGRTVDPVSTYDIASGRAKLSRYDTVVLADVALPPDTKRRKVSAAAYRRALQTFVRGGGQLLLTDAAVPYVRNFGIGGDDALQEAKTNAGHVDFGTDRSHKWEKSLMESASQTYYEVPLGFAPRNEAPHFGVKSSVWTAAKGVTVGTVGEGDAAFTALGSMPYGKGQVAIFGAVLPTPTEENDHVEGLVNYGVTIAGGQVLHAILEYRRK
ncbi:MAG TPA: M14 family metallopeptidase [Frankiaceae bacterium]|nr:M14 family metallopeptidase [Frankiaceae bacterium]